MNYIVIGGGLAGLAAARALRNEHRDAGITLIERNAELGGLLGGIEYPDHGHYFDIGTHIFQETGDATLDAVMLDAVPSEDLLHFPVGKGDSAGTVFAGRLQQNSHFPDLRGSAVDLSVVNAFRDHIAAGGDVPGIDRIGPMMETATARFGREVAESVIGPSLARAYGRPADELAGFAMLLPGWTRVVIDDHADWAARSVDDRYRALVAVPDQSDLPVALHHGRRSFYSRRRGTRAFIDGIAAKLRADGVDLQCGSTILSMNLQRRRVEFIDSSGSERKLDADGIVIATGVIGAAQMLGIDLAAKGFERPMPHWVVSVVLEQPSTSDLCYAYGLDPTCDWYRVTNYRAFSGNPDDRRLSIEVVGRDLDPETGPSKVMAQLRSVGLLKSEAVRFADVRKLGAGFPAPTVRNMRALAGLGEELTSSVPDQVVLGGIGSNSGLFFQNETVKDLYDRVREQWPDT